MGQRTLITRRSLLGGIGALLAAPAIVRAASLMPVSAFAEDDPLLFMGHRVIFDSWVPRNAVYFINPAGLYQDMRSGPDILVAAPSMKKIFDKLTRHL